MQSSPTKLWEQPVSSVPLPNLPGSLRRSIGAARAATHLQIHAIRDRQHSSHVDGSPERSIIRGQERPTCLYPSGGIKPGVVSFQSRAAVAAVHTPSTCRSAYRPSTECRPGITWCAWWALRSAVATSLGPRPPRSGPSPSAIGPTRNANARRQLWR